MASIDAFSTWADQRPATWVPRSHRKARPRTRTPRRDLDERVVAWCVAAAGLVALFVGLQVAMRPEAVVRPHDDATPLTILFLPAPHPAHPPPAVMPSRVPPTPPSLITRTEHRRLPTPAHPPALQAVVVPAPPAIVTPPSPGTFGRASATDPAPTRKWLAGSRHVRLPGDTTMDTHVAFTMRSTESAGHRLVHAVAAFAGGGGPDACQEIRMELANTLDDPARREQAEARYEQACEGK